MDGITYFKLVSQYEGDVTKNKTLDGCEYDRNLHVLNGRDVEDATIEGNDLVVRFRNGNTIRKEGVFSGFAKNVAIEYDPETGKLYFQNNGVKEVVATIDPSKSVVVATDSSLSGDGSLANPLRVNDHRKPGMLEPVSKLVDKTNGDIFPETDKLKVGYRVLSKELTSPFGRLYNYRAIRKIACDLKAGNSEWRIPTKEEWDAMLDAIEPNAADKRHSASDVNKWFGQYSGKLLKSNQYWNSANGVATQPTVTNDGTFSDINDDASGMCPPDPCVKPVCGKSSKTDYDKVDKTKSTVGIDKYGFNALPAGYGDDSKNASYFGDRAMFWTSTHNDFSNAFVKRLDYDKSSTYQDIQSSEIYASLRLVKDYNGSNFRSEEEILGKSYPTVLMPSATGVSKIWTAVNIDVSGAGYESILPNKGLNLPKKVIYYTNEWDGEQWVRVELKEGQTVTLLENGTFIDYALINGELVNKTKAIESNVDKKLDEAVETLKRANANAESNIAERFGSVNGRIDAVLSSLNTERATISSHTVKISEIEEEVKVLTRELGELETLVNENIDVKVKVQELTVKLNEAMELLNSETRKASSVHNDVHIQDGSSFDKDSGVLFLKSRGGQNDITINLGFNFGDI